MHFQRFRAAASRSRCCSLPAVAQSESRGTASRSSPAMQRCKTAPRGLKPSRMYPAATAVALHRPLLTPAWAQALPVQRPQRRRRRVGLLCGQGDRPPIAAEFLFYFALARNRREAVGDLLEEYRTVLVPKFGSRAASAWYWRHVLGSIWPLALASIWRIVLRIGQIVGFSQAYEALRRHF